MDWWPRKKKACINTVRIFCGHAVACTRYVLSVKKNRYLVLLFTSTMSLVSTSLALVIVLLLVVIHSSSLVKAQECDCTTVPCTSAWVIPPYEYSWFNITCPTGQEAILDYSLYCGARKKRILPLIFIPYLSLLFLSLLSLEEVLLPTLH